MQGKWSDRIFIIRNEIKKSTYSVANLPKWWCESFNLVTDVIWLSIHHKVNALRPIIVQWLFVMLITIYTFKLPYICNFLVVENISLKIPFAKILMQSFLCCGLPNRYRDNLQKMFKSCLYNLRFKLLIPAFKDLRQNFIVK